MIICVTSFLLGESSNRKRDSYGFFYTNKANTILLAPPVFHDANKEMFNGFYNTLSSKLSFAGYYVFPSYVISDLLANNNDIQFDDLIDKVKPDLVLYTEVDYYINDLESIRIKITYTLKSTLIRATVFEKVCELKYLPRNDDYNSTENKSFGKMFLEGISTGLDVGLKKTSYMVLQSSSIAFHDLPYGVYHKKHRKDGRKRIRPYYVNEIIH